MAEKLQQGGKFPSMTFDLVGGGKLRIPEDMPGRYAAVLFYRVTGDPTACGSWPLGRRRRPS